MCPQAYGDWARSAVAVVREERSGRQSGKLDGTTSGLLPSQVLRPPRQVSNVPQALRSSCTRPVRCLPAHPPHPRKPSPAASPQTPQSHPHTSCSPGPPSAPSPGALGQLHQHRQTPTLPFLHTDPPQGCSLLLKGQSPAHPTCPPQSRLLRHCTNTSQSRAAAPDTAADGQGRKMLKGPAHTGK